MIDSIDLCGACSTAIANSDYSGVSDEIADELYELPASFGIVDETETEHACDICGNVDTLKVWGL